MQLFLHRASSNPTKCTLGTLSVDGVFECFTLEDPVRPMSPDADGDGVAEGKIMGQTAIPAGVYRISIRHSQRFQKKMMAVEDVPYFTGILIHGGNCAEDTHGCILVGQKCLADRIVAGTSTPAVASLFEKVSKVLAAGGSVRLTVVDGI